MTENQQVAFGSEQWVADSSPLVLLAKVGLLSVLPQLVYGLDIPDTVVAEIMAGPTDDPARLALPQFVQMPAVRVYSRPIPIPTSISRLRLGAGETDVLTLAVFLKQLAIKRGIRVLLDDRSGRNAARMLGINTIGTLGVLIRAKDGGYISTLVPFLHQLRDAGMWVDEQTCRDVAHSVFENWP